MVNVTALPDAVAPLYLVCTLAVEGYGKPRLAETVDWSMLGLFYWSTPPPSLGTSSALEWYLCYWLSKEGIRLLGWILLRESDCRCS